MTRTAWMAQALDVLGSWSVGAGDEVGDLHLQCWAYSVILEVHMMSLFAFICNWVCISYSSSATCALLTSTPPIAGVC